jgi:hypothetical protein
VTLILDGKILSYDDTELYVGNAKTEGDHYYMGVLPERPESIDFADLTKVNVFPGRVLDVLFPDEVGYLVLCVPLWAREYVRWYVRSNNKGTIGGSIEDPYTNLFPAPDAVNIDGRYYRVYVSSYPTQVISEMKFYDN